MKKYVCLGLFVGFLNGFFGGGGGAVLAPMLLLIGKLEMREIFASSVVVISVLCVCSLLCYLLDGNVNIVGALPYLLGGSVGGYFGGKLFQKTSPKALKRVFALLLLAGGLRGIL